MPGWAHLLRPSLNWLLVFIPASLIAQLAHQPLLTFISAALAIIPLTRVIGRATGQLAICVGPRLGGLLNATCGKLTELIVAVLLAGARRVVVRRRAGRSEQAFSVRAASLHTASLVLAVAGLGVPALLLAAVPSVSTVNRQILFAGVTATLIALFALHPALQALNLSPIFVGPILIPVIGNAAERSSAVFIANRDKLDVTLEIAVGSPALSLTSISIKPTTPPRATPGKDRDQCRERVSAALT